MGFWIRQRRALRGHRGWAVAARTLMLVLTLAMAGPGIGLAADLAFHAETHHGAGPAVEAAVSGTVSGAAVDPGLTAHLHCGCHQAAPLETGAVVPPPVPVRPIAARIAQAIPSPAPDRLPRPLRA